VYSSQVKIGLHQSDNCLNQVKIDATTVNNYTAISYNTQDLWRVLHLLAGQCCQFPGTQTTQTIRFLACNFAKCWL